MHPSLIYVGMCPVEIAADTQVSLSPLFFHPEAHAQRALLVQGLEFYLRVCASVCEASRAKPAAEARGEQPPAAVLASA